MRAVSRLAFACFTCRSGRTLVGFRGIQIRLRNRAGGFQFPGALREHVRVGRVRFGLRQRGLGRFERRLERRRVDLEQRLPFVNVRAFLVQALEQHAWHARSHVGRTRGGEPADEVARELHRLRVRHDDPDFRLRGSECLIALAARDSATPPAWRRREKGDL